MRYFLILALTVLSAFAMAHDGPKSWAGVKADMRQHVYYDRNVGADGTVYCDCDWEWRGRSGGIIDHTRCGYETRGNTLRADRIEWEHVKPASTMARLAELQCWVDGGRNYCASNDPKFASMYTDQHNITPSVGEVNANRSNFSFANITGRPAKHGACESRINFETREFEPQDRSKGFVARIYFYMSDTYQIPLPVEKQLILMVWDQQFPPTEWELERDRRITSRIGRSNPFVTGQAQWSLNMPLSGVGLKTAK